jgi:hypothetical protein
MGKLAAVLGAQLVAPGEIKAGDAALEWEGHTVGALRLPSLDDLHGALERMMADVERELGRPLPSLTREDKQTAVRMLEERGAFTLRRSVEEVADALGVSRFTVYNYLNRHEAGEPR